MLVMRELMLGPRRFGDLRKDLPAISANVLTQRLNALIEKGLVIRRKLPPPASVQVYELTPWGYDAEPIIQHLGRWAARSPWHDPTLPISEVSILLSFKTMIDKNALRGTFANIGAQIGFIFGETQYLGRLDEGGLELERTAADSAQVIFEGEPAALAAAAYGKVPLDALAGEGVLHVTGDRELAAKFLSLFTLPDKEVVSGLKM